MKRNHLLSLNGELNRARTGFLRSRSAWLHLVTVWGQYHEKTSLILPVLKSLLLLLLVPLSLLLLVDEITVVTPPDESVVSKYVLKHTTTTTMFKLIFLLILSFYGTIVTYTTFLSRDLLPALFRGSSQIHSGNQTELTTLLNAGATICAVQFSLAFHLCMSLEGTFISQKFSRIITYTTAHRRSRTSLPKFLCESFRQEYIGCGIMVLGGSTDRQCLCCILEDIYSDSKAFLSC